MDRPIPLPCDLDQPFWDGAREGRLMLQRSKAGGRFQAYPRGHALGVPAQSNAAIEWVEASGRGVVETFSVVHRSFYPSIPAPYVFAVVRLEEGASLTTHVVGCPPESVRIGMAVRIVFQPLDDDTALPCARPAAEGMPP